MENIGSSDKAAANASKKIETLISIGAGEMVENTLDKLIRFQMDKYRNSIDALRHELGIFEENYNMTSEKFYQEFESGNLGDEGDFFEWSSLYKNILLYDKRMKEMESLIT